MSAFKPFAGKDPIHSPPIPNGSVWESIHRTCLVQWTGETGPRCWTLLVWYHNPYHVDGLGGSVFVPYGKPSVYTQDELAAVLKELNLTRVDAHFEPVAARR